MMMNIRERICIEAKRASEITAKRDKRNRVVSWLRARFQRRAIWESENIPYILWAVRDPEGFALATKEAVARNKYK